LRRSGYQIKSDGRGNVVIAEKFSKDLSVCFFLSPLFPSAFFFPQG